ncbi:MAG: hypothetical protein K2R98_21080 [Gemmataceae bacterium]|nr:hypothetical protein [Gemmataceae bacterium]
MMNIPQRVAIVGIGGIFPQSPTLERFWANVRGGVDTASEVPPGRWVLSLEDGYDAQVGALDKVYSRRGCFVAPLQLDPDGLDLDPALLQAFDPVYHLALHAGRQAWRDGVTRNLDRRRVGVILGNLVMPTDRSSELVHRFLGRTFEEKVLGASSGAPLNRRAALNRYVTGLPGGVLARALGLGGSSYTLDAACASSLYALKLAVDELFTGRADAMLAGGLCRPDALYTQMGFAQLRALSPTGRCSPFDARGDGLVVGEGAGLFLLKRLGDALKDGDHIYATIAGIGLSNDVHGRLLAPSSEGQLRAMRAAYRQAGWDPHDIDLIECHATGTPVGDIVEFESLRTLWGDGPHPSQPCIIGSVKSNIGHALTAAGAAGLLKVLLALKEKTLPPTANFSAPGANVPYADSPFRVLAESKPWERRSPDQPRRMAVTSFGFGGINAHVLLEEWPPVAAAPSRPQETLRSDARPAVAIVGMGAQFGPWNSLRAFQERVLGGGEPVEPMAPTHWWGATESAWFRSEGWNHSPFHGYYLKELSVPADRFRIPPRELEELLPQQVLMLQVAAEAIADAKWRDDWLLDTGVFIGLGLDFNVTNFHLRWSLLDRARAWAKQIGVQPTPEQLDEWALALRDASGPASNPNRTMGALGGIVASRVAREFHVGGPSFTISSEESSGLRALQVAVRQLQQGELSQAIVGAVDLAGDIRAVLATHAGRPFSRSGTVRPFDADADGTLVGEGAAAVILKRLEDAERDGDRIYAVIRGMGAACGGGIDAEIPDVEAYRTALERAYSEVGVQAESVGYFETHGSGHANEDAMEAAALAAWAKGRTDGPPCALGSVKADIGHAGAAAGLASLVKAALCLHQEVVPPLRNVSRRRADLERFSVPGTPRYWLRDRACGPRRAGVSSFSVDGNVLHVILEGYESSRPRETARLQPLGARHEALFVIEADTPGGLQDGLELLHSHSERCRANNIEALARAWWQAYPTDPRRTLGIALVARNAEELRKHTDTALQMLAGRPGQPGDRIMYRTTPLGQQAQVAFVFPGSGNQFPDMGRELGVQWPEILRRQDEESVFLRSQFLPELFWDRTNPSAIKDQRALLFGQLAVGTLVSDLVREFGVRPHAAIGYSLGESVSLFSLRAWTGRDEILHRMHASTLFTSDLAGVCDAARRTWQLPEGATIDWLTGVISCPAAQVRDALKGRKHVYLLIANSPGEAVIGGERQAVQELVKDLGCRFLPVPGVTIAHCEVVRPVEQAYRALHLLPTNAPAGVRYYSGATRKSYEVTADSAADAVLAQALSTLDIPALIEQAYADGVRVFLEMGPGASCSRIIGQVLGERPHMARSACASGQEGVSAVLRLLGQLIAERIPVDLSKLYGQATLAAGHVVPDARATASSARPLVIPLGGKPFQVPRPPQGKRLEAKPQRETSSPRPCTRGRGDGGEGGELAGAYPLTPNPSPPSTGARGEERTPRDFRNAPAMDPLLRQLTATATAKGEAHEAHLRFSQNLTQSLSSQLAVQMALLQSLGAVDPDLLPTPEEPPTPQVVDAGPKPAFDRAMCLEFAVGSIAKVLGPDFAEVDSFPTRVRLPDEPLMLVDRIVSVSGEPRSLGSGRVVTEHDIRPDAWYLDCGQLPTCLAVEAGQADLFLAGYLGIDFQTRGLAVYRLLDAVVTAHRSLPGPGAVIRYDIRIERFFHHGGAWLFRFNYDSTVDGEPFLTMRDGCAGFFTAAALAAGKGIVHTEMDLKPRPGIRPADWEAFVPMGVETYTDRQIEALRAGDLAGCFGPMFDGLGLRNPLRLPGGRLKLVDRVVHLDPQGGRFGLGLIRGEADIHPDDWFLTCHFVDDQVMPGTLMYECCLHTLRVYLLRLGWVGEQDGVAYEPVPDASGRFKCRGQVIATTKTATYEVSVKEIGYRPEPYVIVDALMYSDGKPIVEITDMSLRLSGLNREKIRAVWARKDKPLATPALFDTDRILAFAIGKPSVAFGEPYRVFDEQRIIARLPGPPYQFLDRITRIEAEPWKMVAGGVIEAQYDVPADAWYFAANRQERMSFAILLEIALQPCGWLAAYLGSALTSSIDLSFRNLGGTATQFQDVTPQTGTLTTTVKITRVAASGGMIIQHYDFDVRSQTGQVYKGETYFGFFSKQALADQVGIRDARPYEPTAVEIASGRTFDYPTEAPFPETQLRMIDRVDLHVPNSGPHGLGFIAGSKDVDPAEWFFKAHFYQDPVCPGSLGLESFLQLLKVHAVERWGGGPDTQFEPVMLNQPQRWLYRGQVLPTDRRVSVQAVVTARDDEQRWLQADGFLVVDGRIIYQMNDFKLRLVTGSR